VSIYNFLIPIFGVSLSSLLLGEGMPGLASLGALALVCLGIVVVNREKTPSSTPAE
jgi:drug/metabolite transporter (DMT)-like permease